MAKKIKDYYDLVYAEDLSRRLQEVTDKFDAQHFMSLVESGLEALEFTQRQELLAKSIKECLPLSYADSKKPAFPAWPTISCCPFPIPGC